MDQKNIGQRIKQRREQIGLTMQDVADKLDVNRSSVMRWENGETNRIKLPIIEKLAQILQTSPDYLMGYKDEVDPAAAPVCTKQDACFLPVLKSVAQTDALCEEENIYGYELADGMFRGGHYFYLQAEGDAMAPCLCDGDLVLVHQRKTLKNGQLGVFLTKDGGYMIREFLCAGDETTLRAFNPYYPPCHFVKGAEEELQVVGVVKESRHKW